ncbi:secondary thiamine-phosphate synthase enzyme YjbQ [Marinospirillum perlucidum]|uniref:secondary thiamine-phosphate synthase enzyme YjbQ n=1 Tax=Marinospirillum perlucidum TaxID=1982602 RepID=UPI000DF48532|nr:secondary thiamine-phosphate synthase enzyme YjbQ [Marinospirillum perlucidum]
MSSWYQTTLQLAPKKRGFHLITGELLQQVPEIRSIQTGLLHLFLQHTSASLTVNENADPAVRRDFEVFFNRLIPENQPGYEHTYEGSDDLPAHFKSSLLSPSLTLPVTGGNLNLGTWQGIYLCEHRNHGGSRRLVVTLQGERF